MPEFTGWMFTDATRLMDCPKCGVKAGSYCCTPKGRIKAGKVPHVERTTALVAQYGKSHWVHPVSSFSFGELLKIPPKS